MLQAEHIKMEKEIESSENQQTQRPGDWILDLFAPTYANAVDALEGKDAVAEESRKVKFVSAFDPESIRNVYERVHTMIKLDEALKKEAKDVKRGTSATASSTTQAEGEKVDLRDSGIWNSEELSVLRTVFRAAKSQISELEVKLRQTERQNAELKEHLTSQEKVLDTKSAKLSEATKANRRLKILCDDLQCQLNTTGMKLDAVTDMWKEIDQEKLRMMKETQELRIALDRERLAREQLEIQLKEARQEVTTACMLAEQNAKTKYEHCIFKLEDELTKTQNELDREKELHDFSKKGLDFLRLHFSKLPLQDILPPGMVVKDQVERISHIADDDRS